MTILTIDIQKTDIMALAKKLEATYDDVQTAFRISIRAVMRWAREEIALNLEEPLPLQEKGILKRIVLKFQNTGQRAGSFFIGLNPVDLTYVDPAPVQDTGGISGGGEYYPSAFFVHIKGRDRPRRRIGKERYPIKNIMVDIQEKATPYLNDEFAQIEEIFWDIFERTLKGLVGKR